MTTSTNTNETERQIQDRLRIAETRQHLTEQAKIFGIQPAADEVAAAGLELKDFHRHDSRTGSWCARIAMPGGRGIYHLAYDPHSCDGSRSVWGPSAALGASGNAEALLLIRTRLADPKARAAARREDAARDEARRLYDTDWETLSKIATAAFDAAGAAFDEACSRDDADAAHREALDKASAARWAKYEKASAAYVVVSAVLGKALAAAQAAAQAAAAVTGQGYEEDDFS